VSHPPREGGPRVDLSILGLIDGFGFFSWRESASDETQERAGAARITSITVWNPLAREYDILQLGLQNVQDSGTARVVRECKAPLKRV